MKQGLEQLITEKDSYDKESQTFIDSLSFAKKEIGEISEMKRTEGWKVLDKTIRQRLQQRISELVKDDLNIQTLLTLLNLADTKTMAQTLEDEINRLLPND